MNDDTRSDTHEIVTCGIVQRGSLPRVIKELDSLYWEHTIEYLHDDMISLATCIRFLGEERDMIHSIWRCCNRILTYTNRMYITGFETLKKYM